MRRFVSVLELSALALCLPALAQTNAPIAPSTAPAPATEEPTFDILEFEVEGNTRLAAAVVERSLRPHMGPGRRLADAEAARAALEQGYQQAGFLTVLVDLPEQRVDEGLLRLVVIEGRIERLRVTGSRYFSQGFIRDRVTELAEGNVPNFNIVQQQLGLLNRGPARQVQPVLRPGTAPGTVEAELKVSDRLPLSGSVELNNRNAADTEPLRLAASLRWDNLLQRDHALALTAITAPQATKQSQVLVANYTAPRETASTNSQASWLGTLVWSDSKLEPLGATTVLGRGTTVGLRHAQTWFRAESSHTVVLGADYKDLRERVVAGSDELSTPLRYVPLQASYSGSWTQGRENYSLSAAFTFGFAGLLRLEIACPGNIGLVDQFACRRLGADGNFAALRLDLRHERELFGGQLLMRGAVQWAQQPLMGGEQFSVGGAGTVRGYYEGEASGDQGLQASAEWRTPNLAPGAAAGTGAGESQPWLIEARLAAFIDAAQALILQTLPGQTARVPLLGSGLGLSLRGALGEGSSWSAALEVAWPQKPARLNPDRDPRWHGRVGLNF